MPKRLIVVSNRLPLTLRKEEGSWKTERSSGGLAAAMNPLLRKIGGEWIGWPGGKAEEDDEQRRAILHNWEQTERCFAVNLPGETAARFYEGYANQSLWPVFHNFPSQLKFDAKNWGAYVEANQIFCRAVVENHQPGDLIWVHDYHLMLLPQMFARIAGCGHRLFPAYSVSLLAKLSDYSPARGPIAKPAWRRSAGVSNPRVFATVSRRVAPGAGRGKQNQRGADRGARGPSGGAPYRYRSRRIYGSVEQRWKDSQLIRRMGRTL